MADIEALRAEWHRATEKDKPHDALKALVELERLEPNEPRWSQRLGETYRRTGQVTEAVDAFVRAYTRYFERGFLPRAIAMAKLVKSLDAKRGDLLERSMPQGGPGVPPPLPFGRPVGKPPPLPPQAQAKPPAAAPPSPAIAEKPIVKPPPLPSTDAPKPPRQVTPPVTTEATGPKPARKPAAAIGASASGGPPPLPLEEQLKAYIDNKPTNVPPTLPVVSKPVKPAPLSRAPDADVDEVRFDDAPDSSIEILLAEFTASEVIEIDVDAIGESLDRDDDSLPPTRPVAADSPIHEGDYDALGAMASFRLFASLSRDALVALADASELVEFVPGAMIIVRDERAFALYAIVSGTARVTIAGSPDIRLVEGDVFGEASLLDEGQRQADVRAESPLMTLRIEKRALDEVTKKFPEVEDALFDLLARRLITNLMHTSPLFAAFEPSVRLELAQKFEVRRAAPGTVIAERGRRSDGLYILLAGHVMAEPEAGVATRIARGTTFGHASLLGSGKADVTVRAASEAVLLRMSAAGFGSLAALYPPALAHLAETANEPLPVSKRSP